MRLRLPIFVVLAALPLRAETIPEAVGRYENLKTGGAVEVFDAEVGLGHLKLSLKRGVAVAVLAGNEQVGFFFRGEGRFTYVSETPEEFPVLKNNLSEVSRWKPVEEAGRMSVSDAFPELLWIAPGTPPLPGKPSTAGLDSEFRRHRERFGRLKSDSLSQRLAYRRVESPAAKLGWAEMTGGKHDALWLFDGSESSDELLTVLKKLEFDSANSPWEWAPQVVSEQPVGRKIRDGGPRPRIALLRVEPTIEADGEDAKFTVDETIETRDRPSKVFGFDLRSRVFAGSALDIRPQRLLRVLSEAGKPLPFDHRQERLLVELPEPVEPGRPVVLRFEMEGKVLHPPSGDSYWILSFDPWFPRPAVGRSEFTWKCSVKVRKPFVPIVSGKTTARHEEGGWNSVTAEFDRPVSLPVVLAGRYSIEEKSVDGRTIRVASYAYTNHRASEHLVTLASQIIKFYEPFLGPFPFPEFTIVEINSYGFGVAPPATMFITQEAFTPHRDDVTKYFSKSLNARFAHEIAHQYWGNQVSWARDEDEWISESFAEYCSAVQVRKEKGDSWYRTIVDDWRGAMKEADGHATLPTADRIEGERAFRDRTNLLYGRGPYLLYALHRKLGDETFFTFLKTYQRNLKWKAGSTALVEDLLHFLTKESYAGFFDRYFWGTEMPTP